MNGKPLLEVLDLSNEKDIITEIIDNLKTKQMTKCKECGKGFQPYSTVQIYCTNKCTQKVAWRKRQERQLLGIEFEPKKVKFVSENFFDWREFPEGVIV